MNRNIHKEWPASFQLHGDAAEDAIYKNGIGRRITNRAWNHIEFPMVLRKKFGGYAKNAIIVILLLYFIELEALRVLNAEFILVL